ncbi:hypothetical protein BCR39DRAFT_519784 [Naematelia encephala]|uniref:NUDE domain-containing protein n=1 Tax=Naematelia encephala TaxID=71784 RepID=A0A1Y2BFB4_9TREE|nr:hypothetical protein BCR39DRAFT_519784 [Naematelia encephala]
MTMSLEALAGPINGHSNGVIHKMPSNLTLGSEESDIIFDTPEQEASHFREKYREAAEALQDTRLELEEFQLSSKELENELENELAEREQKEADQKQRIKRLEADVEDWRNKHVALQKTHSSTTSAMQREMDNLRSERDKTLIALRDLEMGNDELERNERVAVSSLLDVESRYNRAIEEKTLLEQEVVLKQELDGDLQRLKDELRDANNEIAILRDQLTRTIPTPPSSVSVPRSPAQETATLTPSEPPEPISAKPLTPGPLSTGFPRSATSSSIPLMSPSMKRFSTTNPALSRSTTSRNLAAAAAPPASPALHRSRSGLPVASPARAAQMQATVSSKNRGRNILREMQVRLKAADDKIGKLNLRRNVSNPISDGGKRTVTQPPQPALNKRLAALQETPGDRSVLSMQSPNGGWIMVEETETPDQKGSAAEPQSPLQQATQRAVSSASTKTLPSRPGIPSPLTNHLSQSTRTPGPRPPSTLARTTLTSSTSTESYASRPMSPPSSSRPMSPSMLPQPSRSYMRAPSPSLATLSASMSPTSRPSSRTGVRAKPNIGRGPPPVFSQTRNVPTSTPSALRRSTRRSSMGPNEAHLPPTSIPAPKASPGRPMSVPQFTYDEQPPVPRIPSAHLRESKRHNTTVGGKSGVD